MIPRLAQRGRLVVATALLFLFVGTLNSAPAIIGLASAIVAAQMCLYLVFYPTAILLRRKKIELSWWVPPGDQPGGALRADWPFAIHIAFRNHGSRRLRILATHLLTGSGLQSVDRPLATVGRGQQVEVTTLIRPLVCGYHVLHGARLLFGDALGLFSIEAYFPNPIAVKVFPRGAFTSLPALRGVGETQHDQIGMHRVRRRGLSGELRELREHNHGDPFKFIAWKATARRQRLMVRDVETEIVTTRVVALDIGSGMRSGPIGKTPLDWACDTAAGIAKAAVTSGDRVGLVAFDTRTVTELSADTGRHHYLQFVDRLLDVRSIIDSDLTDVTPGELVGLVARYLAHQEAIDVRVKSPPQIDDPAWSAIQAGSDGELYDVNVAAQLCAKMNSIMKDRDKRSDVAHSGIAGAVSDGLHGDESQLAPLRRFCQLRGIELPYQTRAPHGRRIAGLAAAAERAAAAGKVDIAVVISDLSGWSEDEGRLSKALSRLRRAARHVVVVVPSSAAFLTKPASESGQQMRDIMLCDIADSQAAPRRILRQYGIRIVDADGNRSHRAAALRASDATAALSA